MPTTTSAEASLINDTEFLDEATFRQVNQERTVGGPGQGRAFSDSFDALDSGLPIDEAAPLEPHDATPMTDSYPLPVHPPFTESNISLIAAALVLAACLSAGAATAAYVFHDQLTHISARLSANR